MSLLQHGRCFPQSGFLIELNLAQLSLRADHDWWFQCTWVAPFLRPEVTQELHEEEAQSHLPTLLLTMLQAIWLLTTGTNGSKIRRLQIPRSV